MRKKGVSEIITTILLILLVIATIIIVWNVVSRVAKKGAEGIGTEALTTQLEITEAKLWVTGGAQVKIKREAGEGDITSLKFVFEKNDGTTKVIERKKPEYEMPPEFGTKIYDFAATEINERIEKVSVVPMFEAGAGIITEEPESAIKKDADGNRLVYVYEDLQISPNDLISWWKFDGDANDSVGENHGTPNGGVNLSYNDAIRGKVARFDGIDGYVNMGNVIILEGSNDATISAWVKPNTYAIDGACNSGNCDFIVSDYNFGYYFSVQASGLLESSWGNGSNWGSITYTNSIGNVGLGFWTHVTVTKDNGVVKYYINGNLNSTMNDDDTAIGTVSGNFQISKHPGGNIGYWNGTLDDVMIFNRSLSLEEINAIYNNQGK